MSHSGRTGSAARQEVDDELLERMVFLRQLVEELVAFPAASAPRAALRHRLRTLEEAAQNAGHLALVRQVQDALARLQGVAERTSERAGIAERVGELRASILALSEVAAHTASDNHDTAGPSGQKPSIEDEVVDPRISAPMPKGYRDLFFEPAPRTDASEAGSVESEPRRIELTQTVTGVVTAPSVVHVLVLDEPASVERIREGLPQASYEVVGTSDTEQAMALLRAHGCDVVLIAQALAEDSALKLVERMRSDVAASQRRVLVLAPRGSQAMAARMGCDGWVRTPVEPLLLDALLERLLGRGGPRPTPLAELTEGTVDDIAQRLTDEIRRGLTDTLQVGRDERISIDDSRELVAVAWSAIGRVRTHLSQRSMGKVRFADQERRLLDAVGSQPAELVDAGAATDTQWMAGQRILIADDDPAVLWFFAGLLREAGAVVWEAKNGREALMLAQKRRPHLVISDILMPKLDGFALCRELKRDVSLWDVPVVLLSWKDDFLLRMRELQSGAVGYLRKEAGSRQILATVSDALRPRARLRAQLATDEVVTGRIGQHSVLTLIELAAERTDAVIKVQDSYNLYEIQVRDGNRIAATRTASDGSFSRGPLPLRQALGVRSGCFEVASEIASLRGALELPLAEALRQAACAMTALVESVSGSQLLRIGRISLDDELLSALALVLPASTAEVVRLARDEQSAFRDHIVSGDLSPHVAEEQLVELARAGAILAVRSVEGENLVAEAFAEASERMTVSTPPPARMDEPTNAVVDDGFAEVDATAEPGAETLGEAGFDEQLLKGSLSTRPRRETEVLSFAESGASADRMEGEGEAVAEVASADATAASMVESIQQPFDGTQVERPMPPSAAEHAAAHHASSDERRAAGRHVERSFAGTNVASKISIALTMAALAGLGYAGVRVLSSPTLGKRKIVKTGSADRASGVEGTELATDRQAATDPAQAARATSTLVDAPGDVGRELPFIDRSAGVEVAENEGLLVVNCERCEGSPTVRVGDRAAAKVPVALALPEGRHELVLSYDGRTRFRYLVIARGQTRVVDVP